MDDVPEHSLPAAVFADLSQPAQRVALALYSLKWRAPRSDPAAKRWLTELVDAGALMPHSEVAVVAEHSQEVNSLVRFMKSDDPEIVELGSQALTVMSGQGDHLTESTFGGGEFTLQVKELGYCGDGDTLGNKVWPSAPRLCELLLEDRARLSGRSVIELGCGPGVPGILASKLGSGRVVLTDFEAAVLDNCRTNAELNAAGGDAVVEVRQLDWRDDPAATIAAFGQFDVVLAADTCYDEWHGAAVARMCSTLLKPESVGPDVIAVLGDRRARDGIPQFEAEMERLGFEPVHLVQAEPMSEYRFRRTAAAAAAAVAAVAAADFAASTGVALAEAGLAPVDPFVAKLMAMARSDGDCGGLGRAVVELELDFDLDAPAPTAADAAGVDPFVAKLVALAQANEAGDGLDTPVVAGGNSGGGGGGGVPTWPAAGTPEEATAEAAFQAMLTSSATKVADGVYADTAQEAHGAAATAKMTSGDSLAAMLMSLSSHSLGATDWDAGPAFAPLPAPAMALEHAMADGPDLTMNEDDPFVAQLMALARANEAEDDPDFDGGGGGGGGGGGRDGGRDGSGGGGGGGSDGSQSGGEALEDMCRDLLGALHTKK